MQPRWTFLSNHAHVLLLVARHPEILIRDLALQVGITERAVQRIMGELVNEGYLVRERRGRRNAYIVNPSKHLRHPVESQRTIEDLIRLLQDPLPASYSSE